MLLESLERSEYRKKRTVSLLPSLAATSSDDDRRRSLSLSLFPKRPCVHSATRPRAVPSRVHRRTAMTILQQEAGQQKRRRERGERGGSGEREAKSKGANRLGLLGKKRNASLSLSQRGACIPPLSRLCPTDLRAPRASCEADGAARRRARGDGAAGEGHLVEAGRAGREGKRVEKSERERERIEGNSQEILWKERSKGETKEIFLELSLSNSSKNQKKKAFFFLFAPFVGRAPLPASGRASFPSRDRSRRSCHACDPPRRCSPRGAAGGGSCACPPLLLRRRRDADLRRFRRVENASSRISLLSLPRPLPALSPRDRLSAPPSRGSSVSTAALGADRRTKEGVESALL